MGVDWINLAEDRVKGLCLVKMIIYLLVQQYDGCAVGWLQKFTLLTLAFVTENTWNRSV